MASSRPRQHPGLEDEVNWDNPDFMPYWTRERYDFRPILKTRQVIGQTPEDEARIQRHVDWLVEDMGKHGQKYPIFVKRYDKKDLVHPGVSRMKAAETLGWTWLWAIVSDRRTV